MSIPLSTHSGKDGYMAAFADAESPFTTARKMIEGRYPCLECKGSGKLPRETVEGSNVYQEIKCKSCHGTGLEIFKPELVARVTLENEKSFRKIMGYRDLWALKAILDGSQPATRQAVA